MSIDTQETLNSSHVPEVVLKIQKVFTERDSYTRQLNEWKTNCDLLKKAGEVDDLPARPEPPSSLKKADALDENLNEGSKESFGLMKSIHSGVNARAESLGMPFGEEEEKAAKEKVTKGLESMSQLIDSLDNVASDDIEPEMARVMRAQGILKNIKSFGGGESIGLTVKLLEKCPEVLHFEKELASNIVLACSQNNIVFGNKNSERIWSVLTAESSPLDKKDRGWVSTVLAESVGYRMYGVIDKSTDAQKIDPETVSKIIGVKIPDQVWRETVLGSNVDFIVLALAKASWNSQVSQADRKKLQGIVLGCVRYMFESAEAMKDKSGTMPENGKTRKKLGAQAMIELIDKGNESLSYDYLQEINPSDPFTVELQRISKERKYNLWDMYSSGPIIGGQNSEILEKRSKDVSDFNEKERIKREVLEAEQKEKDRLLETKRINDLAATIDPILQQVRVNVDFDLNSGIPAYSRPLREPMLEKYRAGEISKDQYEFLVTLFNKYDKLHGSELYTSRRERSVVDSKGIFGIGAKSHLESYLVSDHAGINERLSAIKEYQARKQNEAPKMEDEAEKLALRLLLELPDSGPRG